MGLDKVAGIIPKVWGCKLSIWVLKVVFFFFPLSNRSKHRIWGQTFCLGLGISSHCWFCPALRVTCAVMGPTLIPPLSLALCSCAQFCLRSVQLLDAKSTPGPPAGCLWPVVYHVGG